MTRLGRDDAILQSEYLGAMMDGGLTVGAGAALLGGRVEGNGEDGSAGRAVRKR